MRLLVGGVAKHITAMQRDVLWYVYPPVNNNNQLIINKLMLINQLSHKPVDGEWVCPHSSPQLGQLTSATI